MNNESFPIFKSSEILNGNIRNVIPPYAKRLDDKTIKNKFNSEIINALRMDKSNFPPNQYSTWSDLMLHSYFSSYTCTKILERL